MDLESFLLLQRFWLPDGFDQKQLISFASTFISLSLMEADDGGNNSGHASKQRLRWTHELHERFVDAVAQLGGPDSEFPLFLL